MRRGLLLFLMAGVVVVAGLSGAFETRAQTQMPRMNFRERTLKNGMHVLSVVDKSSPTVAINVWYHVGSKDDPDHRSGFAHLFEHIMFKSTRNMKAEMMDRLTEDVGGNNNAFTEDDVTVYYEVIPSNYLETLLWAEADRLAGLTVDEENFKSERAVVEEEYRQSVLAPPYGKFFYMLQQKSFSSHPYQRPTIGSIEDLDASTLENVQKFHATYYRPDNATLVVVGDFDPKQLDAWVDQYFGPVPKPDAAIPRVSVPEPPRTKAQHITTSDAAVPLPAFAITFLAPDLRSDDALALELGVEILAGGESSRMHRTLVYEKELAQSAEGLAGLREDLGLLVFKVV